MALRKIALMYKIFGYGFGSCRDCPHLCVNIYDKKYYKCGVYGNSNSEATDWKISNAACGARLMGKEEIGKYRPIVELVSPVRHTVKNGQISRQPTPVVEASDTLTPKVR